MLTTSSSDPVHSKHFLASSTVFLVLFYLLNHTVGFSCTIYLQDCKRILSIYTSVIEILICCFLLLFMAVHEGLTEAETGRVESLLRLCFPQANFEKDVSCTFAIQADDRSFWSKIVRVHLDWKNVEEGQDRPTSIFMKVPRISENARLKEANDYSDLETAKEAEFLLILTKYEVSFYRNYGNDIIPHFPMPNFFAAEDVTEPGTGIIALEDLSDRVKKMDLFPGLSLIQLERVMDALAGFHHHFYTKEDQSWVSLFDRASEIDKGFQDVQFGACQMFEKIRPDLFKSKVSALREYFSPEAAISAHYSYKELGVPPAPVHFDMNPTNLLWDKEMRKLIAIIDYQLLHTGNFAEDIARTLMLTMSRQQRWSHTNTLLKRYHDTLTSLFNGNPPYPISKVHEAYELIFPYSMNFGVFAMATYFDMYNRLEQDEVKRKEIQNELADRAYGAIIDAERYIRSRQNSRSLGRV